MLFDEINEIALRLCNENTPWGHDRIVGQLANLAHQPANLRHTGIRSIYSMGGWSTIVMLALTLVMVIEVDKLVSQRFRKNRGVVTSEVLP